MVWSHPWFLVSCALSMLQNEISPYISNLKHCSFAAPHIPVLFMQHRRKVSFKKNHYFQISCNLITFCTCSVQILAQIFRLYSAAPSTTGFSSRGRAPAKCMVCHVELNRISKRKRRGTEAVFTFEMYHKSYPRSVTVLRNISHSTKPGNLKGSELQWFSEPRSCLRHLGFHSPELHSKHSSSILLPILLLAARIHHLLPKW